MFTECFLYKANLDYSNPNSKTDKQLAVSTFLTIHEACFFFFFLLDPHLGGRIDAVSDHYKRDFP